MRRQPSEIKAMFNEIAPTYDALNHLLSFGLDIRWRKQALKFVEGKRGGAFLDIAAGSGDFSLEALRLNPQHIVATDFAYQMLDVFQHKLGKYENSTAIRLASCDVLYLPFRDFSFDVTMVAFGIRNFSDRPIALKEMFRVLKPSGISLILELTAPTAPLVSQLYAIYARGVLPLIGKIISRHNSAYRYLPESIAQFPEREEFISLMVSAGFVDVKAKSLTFGAATIYVGRKSEAIVE